MKHKNPCLICSVHPVTAVLEDWMYIENANILTGFVFKDSKKRWEDNHWIQTSKVINFDPSTSHARTLNSNYILGKKR